MPKQITLSESIQYLESPLGQILSAIIAHTTTVLETHSINKADPIEKKQALALTQAVHNMAVALQGTCLLFDRKAEPNILSLDMINAARKIRNSTEELKKALSTPEAALFKAIEIRLPSVVEQLKKKTKRDLAFQKGFFNEHLQELLREKKEQYLEASAEIPGINQDECFDQLINELIPIIPGSPEETFESMNEENVKAALHLFKRRLIKNQRFYRIIIAHPISYDLTITLFNLLNQLPESLHLLIPFFNPKAIEKDFSSLGFRTLMALMPNVIPFQLKHIPMMQALTDAFSPIESYSYDLLFYKDTGVIFRKERYSAEEFYTYHYGLLTDYFQQITLLHTDHLNRNGLIQEESQRFDLLLALKKAETNFLSENGALIDIQPISTDEIKNDLASIKAIDAKIDQIQLAIIETQSQRKGLKDRLASYQTMSVYELAQAHQALQTNVQMMNTSGHHTEFLTAPLPKSVIQLNLIPQTRIDGDPEPIAQFIEIKTTLTQTFQSQNRALEQNALCLESKIAALNILKEEAIIQWKLAVLRDHKAHAAEIMTQVQAHQNTVSSLSQSLSRTNIADKPTVETLEMDTKTLHFLEIEKNNIHDLFTTIKATLRFSTDMLALDPAHELQQQTSDLYRPVNELIQQLTQSLNQHISALHQIIHQGRKDIEIASFKTALNSSDPQKFQHLLKRNEEELKQCGDQITQLNAQITEETEQYQNLEQNINRAIQSHQEKQAKNDKIRVKIIKSALKILDPNLGEGKLSPKESANELISLEKSATFFERERAKITERKNALTQALIKRPNKQPEYIQLQAIRDAIHKEKKIIPYKVIDELFSSPNPPPAKKDPSQKGFNELLKYLQYDANQILIWETYRQKQIDRLGVKVAPSLPNYSADREILLERINESIRDAADIIRQAKQLEDSITDSDKKEQDIIKLEAQMVENNSVLATSSVEAADIQAQQEPFAQLARSLNEKNIARQLLIEQQKSLLTQGVAFKSLIEFIEKMSIFNLQIQALNQPDQLYVSAHELNHHLVQMTQKLSIEQQTMNLLLTQIKSTLQQTNHPALCEDNLESIRSLLRISEETLIEAIQTKKTKTRESYETFCIEIDQNYQGIKAMEATQTPMIPLSIDLSHAQQLIQLADSFKKETHLMLQMDETISDALHVKNKPEKLGSDQSSAIVNLAIEMLSRVSKAIQQHRDEQAQLFSKPMTAESQALFALNQRQLSTTREQYLNPEIASTCDTLVSAIDPLDTSIDSQLKDALKTLHTAQSSLAAQIDINQEHNQRLAERIALRTYQVNRIMRQLDQYQRVRSSHFAIKDYFSPVDKERRARFIEQLKNDLEEYTISGQFDALREIIDTVQSAIPRFPGQHLQGVFYQTLNTLYDLEPEYAATRSKSDIALNEKMVTNHHEEALRLLKQKPHQAQMMALYNEIEKIERYGLTLSSAESSRTQGTQLTDLADELQTSIDQFIIDHAGHIPSQDTFLAFKNRLIAHIHHLDSEMKKHRHAWKPLLANVTLGVSTLGIALGIQLLQSKLSQGHANLFFAKTNRQLKIEALSEFVQHLN